MKNRALKNACAGPGQPGRNHPSQKQAFKKKIMLMPSLSGYSFSVPTPVCVRIVHGTPVRRHDILKLVALEPLPGFSL